MRITNKIMQNNSLYNINNNKVTEDNLNTQLSTGKKISRPSDDPVVAIRALRLRSTVTELTQFYEKNAEDADSWLSVTEDSLSTITDVITDALKNINKGANEDLTLSDIDTILSQLNALSDEYYSTGNVDYAGRYIFTGYRTDTSLTYQSTTTDAFTDINDEFNASNIDTSKRVTNLYNIDAGSVLNYTTDTDGNITYTEVNLESDMEEISVGRLRLSYDNLDYTEGDGNTATVKWRENLTQPATSTITSTNLTVLNLTYTDSDGVERTAHIPVTTDYSITIPDSDGSTTSYYATYGDPTENMYTVLATHTDATTGTVTENQFQITTDGAVYANTSGVATAVCTVDTTSIATASFSDGSNSSCTVPLLAAVGQQYTINYATVGATSNTTDADGNVLTAYTFTNNDTQSITVNSDGTFTYRIKTDDDATDALGTTADTVIQFFANGSIKSSYSETSLVIDTDHIIYSTTSEAAIDAAYADIDSDTTTGDGYTVYLNADTGELLMDDELTSKLSSLKSILNAKTIDIVYDKKEWSTGDIRPQNLFSCVDAKGIIYNGGNNAQDIAYEVGYAQSIVVNTTASSVFTTNVKRDVADLQNIVDKLDEINTTIDTLKDKLEATTDSGEQTAIQSEIDAARKAYNYLREELQERFGNKITSMQASLDKANIAVTDNGTRSERLSYIKKRLQNQLTTFKTLTSNNEDCDLAETATRLTTAEVTYQASLMATSKIMEHSLMDYI